MCTTKAPKAPPPEQKKPVQYLNNPWVDGLGIVGSGTRGRNSLRNDMGSGRIPVTTDPGAPLPPAAPPRPTVSDPFGGDYGGGLGGRIRRVTAQAMIGTQTRKQQEWDQQHAVK